ncbi:hypothetical protein OWM07_06420 [Deferribacter thermophilus]|uniref:hypothetical protein n=1 Tax=Deferribacter thermophilus TaxID=53573 RepID=UPI003C1BB08A
MKKIVVLLILLLFKNLFAADPSDYIKALFPDVSELEGGDKKWITTAFVKDYQSGCFNFNKKYTYFGDKEDIILDIKRKKMFEADVNLYFCKNAIVASKIFDSLKSVTSDFKQKVGVGDKGVIFANKGGNGYNAKYTLLFQRSNFVVKIYSDDGFALVDFTEYFEKSINEFIIKNLEYYLSESINLKFIKSGYITKSKAVFLKDMLSNNVIIKGQVLDYHDNPIKDVEVKVESVANTVKTDENGDFIINLNQGKKESKILKLKVYLEKEKIEDKKEKFFYISLKNNKLVENVFVDFDRKLVFTKKNEKVETIFADDFIFNDENIGFSLNCGEGLFGDCRITVSGSVNKDGEVAGLWKMNTKKGEIEGVALKKFKNKSYNLKEICEVNNINDPSNIPIEFELLDNSDLNSVFINCSQINNYFLHELKISFLYSNQNSVSVYTINRDEKVFKLGDFIGKFKPSDGKIEIKISKSNFSNGNFLLVFSKNEREVDLDNAKIEVVNYNDDVNTQIADIYAKFAKTDRDIVSFKNQPIKDGKKDLLIKLKIKNVRGELSDIKVVSEGVLNIIWNLNPSDIYPVVAIFRNGKYINSERININLDEKGESFELYIADSNLMDKNKTYVILNINNSEFKVKVDNGAK